MPVPPDPITKVTDPPLKAAGDPPVNPVDGAPPEKPVRPEWLSKPFDGYWTDDKGFDATKFTTDYEALNAAKVAADERAKKIPEKIEDYEVALPDGFQLPEGVDPKAVTFDTEDPILKELLPTIRETAKKLGLDKDGFKQLVGLKTQLDLAEQAHMKKLAGAQKVLLGTKAEARVTAVTTWLQGKLGNELANTLLPMMFTAKQVEAFEKVVQIASGTAAKPNGGGRETEQPQGNVSEEEWAKLSPTRRIEVGRELDAKRGVTNHA